MQKEGSALKKGLFFALLAVLATASLASGAVGGDEAHGGSWMNFFFRIINFIIFVGIIWKLAGKRMKEFFSGRRYQIETELKDLETRRAETEKHLKDVEKRIASLKQEREQILDEFRKQGEALKESIVASAQQTAEKIRSQAEASASQELKQAMDDVRAQIAELVAEAAEKMMVEKLSKEDHAKLIDKYLTKVVLN